MADSRDKYAAERAAIIVGMLRPGGMSTAEMAEIIPGKSDSTIKRLLCRIRKLVGAEYVFRFGIPSRNNIRLFIGKENFEAWAGKMKAEATARKRARDKAKRKERRLLAQQTPRPKPKALAAAWKAPKPPKPPRALKPQTRAGVDYSRAVTTVCPSIRYDPRYQVGPGEMVPVVFRAIPLGGTL